MHLLYNHKTCKRYQSKYDRKCATFQGAVPSSDKGLEAGNMDDKEGLVQNPNQGGRRGFVIEVCTILNTKYKIIHFFSKEIASILCPVFPVSLGYTDSCGTHMAKKHNYWFGFSYFNIPKWLQDSHTIANDRNGILIN